MLKRIKNSQFSSAIISSVLYIILKIIYSTVRLKPLNSTVEEKNILNTQKSLCFLWHQQLAIAPIILQKLNNAHAVASPHKDGRLIGNIIQLLGHKVIWGSTNRNPLSTIKKMIALLNQQTNIIITPDGPRGPAKQFNSTAHKLAAKKNASIILFACQAEKYFQLGSWDKMQIPLPFTQITYKMMMVNINSKTSEIDKMDLQTQLEQLNQECEI